MDLEKRTNYTHLPETPQCYRAFIMTCEGPLNLHIQILDWSEDMKSRYSSAKNYKYEYVSEEFPGQILSGTIYICHLKGIEIAKDSYSSREAGIWMKKKIDETVGWFFIRLSDIDVYKRILVTLYHPETGESINDKLLEFRTKIGTPIACEYIRPQRERIVYAPNRCDIPMYLFCDLYGSEMEKKINPGELFFLRKINKDEEGRAKVVEF